MSLLAGININADQLSAFRLGGDLPMIGEFPALLPGYYFQELSATPLPLLERQLPRAARLPQPLESDDQRIDGAGRLPRWIRAARRVQLGHRRRPHLRRPDRQPPGGGGYGYGFQAMRPDGRGGQSINILCQFDWGRYKSAPIPDAVQPGTARGLFQLFAH